MMNQVIVGAWDIDVRVKDWPKEVNSAEEQLNKHIGASYKVFAYLGKQVVKGINYAVLAEQTLATVGEDNNVVLVIFNVWEDKIVITSIERVLEGHEIPGGIVVAPTTDIPEDAMKDFEKVFNGFVGSDVKPFAYLGSQVVSGINRFLAAEVKPVTPHAKTKVSLVTVNAKCNTLNIANIL